MLYHPFRDGFVNVHEEWYNVPLECQLRSKKLSKPVKVRR